MPTATTTAIIIIRAAPGGRGPPPLPAKCSVGLAAARSCRELEPTFSRRVGGEGRRGGGRSRALQSDGGPGGDGGPVPGGGRGRRPVGRAAPAPPPEAGLRVQRRVLRRGPRPRGVPGSFEVAHPARPGPARPLTPSPHLRRRQACLQRCTEPVLKGERAVTAGMGRMQEHLARCTGRCEDLARQALPAGAGESQIARAQAQLEACVAKCAAEQAGQVRPPPPPLAARRSWRRHHTGRGHY